MVLYIRDGLPVIRTPHHNGGVVPDDFMILLGVAVSFHDPDFRRMALRAALAAAEELEGIITNQRVN